MVYEIVYLPYLLDFEDILALAKSDPAKAVRNSATLRRFAVDVYAFDIAVPGEGCSGSLNTVAADGSQGAAVTTTSAAPVESTATSTAVSGAPKPTITATSPGTTAATAPMV
jgi:hypothetical protein